MTSQTDKPDDQSSGFTHSLLSPLRLGVIGCDLGRVRYGGALAALPSIRIAGLTDPDDHYARVWARELGGKTPIYADALNLITQPLDAVLVAVPLRQRAEQIAEALRARRPVLAEMPFALSLSDFDDLIALAAHHQTLLLPALPRRLDPYFRCVMQELNAASIGPLQQVRCAWSFPVESVQPEGDVVGAGWNAVLQTLACQTADLCRWWQGAGVTVTADVDLPGLANVHSPQGRRPQEGTLANIIVAHQQGQSTHQITRGRSIHPDERYILTGTEGNMELVVSAGATASATSAPQLRRQRVGKRAETIAAVVAAPDEAQADLHEVLPTRGRRKPAPLSPAVERIRLLLAHFAACVQAGELPAVTASDARAALEIVQAAYVSTYERTKVTLPLRRAPDIAGILQAFSAAPRALPPSD
jgi:predicted dehydrogenase